MKKISKETLQEMNKKQLYDYCRANGIKGYSNMNKAYINNLILQSYKSGNKYSKENTIFHINKIKNIARKYSNKTKTFEKEWWKSDTGYCPIAAYNLSKHLNSIGYKSLVIYGSYKWMDSHYWVSVKINNKEIWLDPTYYQFKYNKNIGLGGGILIGHPKEFLSTGYKKKYICPPEGMTKFRSDLFYVYSGGKNNPKYKV